jgi:hypothetical protein
MACEYEDRESCEYCPEETILTAYYEGGVKTLLCPECAEREGYEENYMNNFKK